ncbi:family 2 glycosyl transferase [Pedobacter psychrophilus]|uniref:Family 2 glycosyl transferase n=1 Tax=Pedobacter psychrophilus TaxID=1826909 RepID=A0A179DJ48_9SPHI|nr:glycosyltransferase family 2 protein [Pedobacter psychrophilus]OAQ40463.1 family 2 glycosyl transferase [Pedobacter psychrophilus]
MDGLSIILPNYNGKHLFEKYFEKNLEIFKSLKCKYEIIIVDDASTDNSVSFLKKNYNDKITIIEKKENGGFSKTCNIGIHASKFEIIFLLNTDVLLTPNYFQTIFKCFEKEDTFGVMGRIIGMNDDIIQDSARLPIISGKKIKPSHFFYIDDKDFLTPTLYLSGAIALIDSKKLKELKGFNELFSPFYGEDFELSLRAWRLGWKCYYHHESVCKHEISGSTKNYEKKYWIKNIYFRNKYFAHYLHYDGFDLFLWLIQIIITDLIPSVFCFNRYKIKAYKSLIKKKIELDKYKSDFRELMAIHHSNKTVSDVFLEIREMIKGQKIETIN